MGTTSRARARNTRGLAALAAGAVAWLVSAAHGACLYNRLVPNGYDYWLVVQPTSGPCWPQEETYYQSQYSVRTNALDAVYTMRDGDQLCGTDPGNNTDFVHVAETFSDGQTHTRTADHEPAFPRYVPKIYTDCFDPTCDTLMVNQACLFMYRRLENGTVVELDLEVSDSWSKRGSR